MKSHPDLQVLGVDEFDSHARDNRCGDATRTPVHCPFSRSHNSHCALTLLVGYTSPSLPYLITTSTRVSWIGDNMGVTMTKKRGTSLGIGYRGFALFVENRYDFHHC
jgi:hypothetical protein